jgi:hypothetical protein
MTIFSKLKNLLHLSKKEGDVTSSPLHSIFTPWGFQMFSAPHQRNSMLVSAYWACYRFFKYNSWGNPCQMYRDIRWFIQRGRRGWSDRDTWSLDHYLSSWMPEALRHLKETKQGVPSSMFKPEDCGEEGNPTDIGLQQAQDRWNAIIDKMIAAFEAHRRIQDGMYEDELGEYPLYRPAGVSANAWGKIKDDRFEATEKLRQIDLKVFEEGMALFVLHYSSLWD